MDVIKVMAPDHNNTALEIRLDLEDETENQEPVDDILEAYGINGNPPSYLTPLLAIQVYYYSRKADFIDSAGQGRLGIKIQPGEMY